MASRLQNLINGNSGVISNGGRLNNLTSTQQMAVPPDTTPTIAEKASQNNGGILGGIGYLGEKTAVGFMSSVEGIWDYAAGGLAKLFGADDWAEEQFANDWFGDWYSHPEEWFKPSGAWQTAGDIAGGIGTSLPAIATVAGAGAIAAVSGGTLAPVAVGLIGAGTAGLGAAGNATKQAYKETGVLTGKEFGYGALAGFTEGAIEGVSNVIGMGTGQVVKSIGKAFAKETTKTVAKQGVIKTLAKGFIGEAFEEGVAEVLSPVYQRMTYNPDAQNASFQEVAYAAFIGGMSGMIMNGANVTIDSGNSFIKGSNLVERGLDAEVIGLSQQLTEFEGKNNTGDETFQSISQIYTDLTQSLVATNGKITTVTQKKLLGDLHRANTIAVFKPMIARSAANIVNNAELIAQRLNEYGYKTADGKPLTFTAEQLREGVDTDNPTSFSEALKNNNVLRTLAIADATGHLVMDTARFEQATLAGKRLASQVDLNRFIETATQSELNAVSQALGIEDWSTLDADTFNEKIATFIENGGVQMYSDRRSTVQELQAIPAETARPIPKRAPRRDGLVRYADGSTQIAISKQGDAYMIYDYTSGLLSKNMTASEVNKLLREYNTQQADLTSDAKAQIYAETKLRQQAEEIDAYARDNIPDYSKLSAPNQSMIRKVIREGRAKGMSDEDVLAYAKISAHAGVDIVFDKQATVNGYDEKGAEKYADGFYDPKTNRIVVNPNAKRSHERLLIHELEHVILKGKKGDSLITQAFKNMDEDTRSEIISRYSQFYSGKGIDAAERINIFNDEVSAHYAEDVLSNKNLLEQLVKAEPTLKDKILFFFKGAAEDYASVPQLSRAAKRYYNTYRKLFNDFSERNFQNNATEANVARLSGNISDARFSLQFADHIAENQRRYILGNKVSITQDELELAIEQTAQMVETMSQYQDILPEDKVGKTLVKNGSYDISVENTTICVRTLAYNSFVDMVSEKIGRPLTQMESFLVSQKLYDIAKEPQCLYCYVSLDRKAYNDMILRYIDQRDTAIAAYESAGRPEITRDSQLYKDFLAGRKDTKDAWRRYSDWIDHYKKGEHLLSPTDVATEAKRAALSRGSASQAAQIKDMLKYAQSASWAKKQTQYVAYYDDILRMNSRVVRDLNQHYGLRWYSFSDYSGAFIVENMQQITDASIRGLKGLAYTKDTDFVKIFAPTGMNINISVYAKKVGDHYEIDPSQSANIDEAIELRKKFSNVGIVVVATDQQGVEWALAQEWSDAVIPFHTVRTGAQVAEFYNWTVFNSEQNDIVEDQNLWDAYVESVASGMSESARKKISKLIYPSEHQNDRETYLRLCKERGLKPRFSYFLDNPGYMKLVNETRQSEAETVPLKPVFNVDAAEAAFQKFVDKGGYYEGWYNDGIDVESEAETVAQDVLAGKKANEVSYGRQDIDPESIQRGRKSVREHGRRYALCEFEDGQRFVDVKTEQSQFDGLSTKEKTDLATKIIKSKFQSKVIGLENKAFVNGVTIDEYTHPSKHVDEDLYVAKMHASTELDNLMDAGFNFRVEADGLYGHKHPSAVGGFGYFDVIFRVSGEYYQGVINIENNQRGKRLKDITKIRNITEDVTSQYGDNPKYAFLRDVSMDSIPDPDEKVNRNSENSSDDERLAFDADYMSAVNSGDMETAQRMVDEAAKKAGYSTEHLYHGTSMFGFTNIDVSSASDDSISFFVTNRKEVASGYMPWYEDDASDLHHDDVRRIGVPDKSSPRGLSHSYSAERILTEAQKVFPEYKDARVATDDEVLTDLKTYWLTETIEAAEKLREIDLSIGSNKLRQQVRDMCDAVIAASKEDTLDAWKDVGNRYKEFDNIDIPYDATDMRPQIFRSRILGGLQQIGKVAKTTTIMLDGKLTSTAAIVDSYNSFLGGETLGMYDLYTKQGNQLVIQGRGNSWNQLPLGKFEVEYMEWLGDKASEELSGKRVTTRDVAAFAKAKGYRSVAFYDIYDNGAYGSAADISDVYAFFYPNEDVKSADPVTYDDNGDVIPLSKRFNASNPDIRYALSDTRDSIMTDVDPKYEPTVQDKIFSGWTASQIAFTNAQAGIESIGKKYGVSNIESLVQAARSGGQQAEEMIAGGQWRIGSDSKTYQGEGLEQIMRPISRQGEEVKGDFFDYLFNYHNMSRMSLEKRSIEEQQTRLDDIKKNVSTLNKLNKQIEQLQDQIKALGRTKKDMEIKRDLRAKLAKLKAEAKTLKKTTSELDKRAKAFVPLENKPVLGTTDENGVETVVTAEQSETIVKKYEEAHPEFKETAEKLWAFLRNLNQYRVDTGLISQDTFDYLAKLYPHYVPTYRTGATKGIGAIEGKYNLSVKTTVKTAKGSTKDLLPPDVMIARQVMETVRAGRINQLANALYEGAQKSGDTTYIEIVSRKRVSNEELAELDPTELRPKDNEVVFFRDGERITMRVSKEIFAGFNAFNPAVEINNPLINAARAINNGFKRLVTSLNPAFLLRNTIRDIQDAGINTKYGKTFMQNYARAAHEISHNGKLWQLYKAMGGFSSSIFDFEKGFSGVQNKWGLTKAEGNLLKKTLQNVENANAFVEQLPRLAEFISSIEAGNTAEQAILDSADVTTNFGRAGNITKALNRTLIPFLNPSVQGCSKMIRNVTSIRSTRQFASLALKAVIVGVAPMVLNMLMYDDDEDYKNLRDNDKENNFLFKVGDTFVKIPRGRVASVLGGLINRSKSTIEGEDVDWAGYVKNIMQQVTPVDSMSRTIFSPFADVANNLTWYGSAIEGRQFENTAPKDRYDESTSSIAIAIGKVINYSPKKIHYLLDQYSGVIGDFILPATTAKAEKDFLSGNFTLDPATSNRLSTDFYEIYDKAQYAKTDGDDIAACQVRYLNKVKSAINDMYKQKSEIQNNPDLSNADKLQQTRVIQLLINEAYKTALQDFELYTKAFEATAGIPDQNIRFIEATRLMYGAERALSEYNDDVYAKCQTLNKAGIDYEMLYNYHFTVRGITGDKDAQGNTISGSKRKKVVSTIKTMKISVDQKLLLICASGYSLQDNDLTGISASNAEKRLLRYILSLKGATQEDKAKLAEMCGFEVRNGRVVINSNLK